MSRAIKLPICAPTALLLVAIASCMVSGQQYVPVQVYIPTFVVNNTAPGYNGTTHNATYFNNANNNNNYNGYRPPSSYSAYGNHSTQNNTQDGHLLAGQIQLNDRLLFNQVYRKESRWWSSREKDIEYPAASPAGYTRHEVISAIRIYNQFLDGNTARATVKKGGVGFQYVKIHLESKRGKGFQFLVQIFGH